MALFGTVSSVGTLGPVRFAWALIALLASARQQRPLLPHEDLPHTHKPRDFTTRDDVEKKHRAPEPRSSPTLKLRPQRATPSAPKAVLPRPLRTSGTSRECDLLLAQPFPLMYGTAPTRGPRGTGCDGARRHAPAGCGCRGILAKRGLHAARDPNNPGGPLTRRGTLPPPPSPSNPLRHPLTRCGSPPPPLVARTRTKTQGWPGSGVRTPTPPPTLPPQPEHTLLAGQGSRRSGGGRGVGSRVPGLGNGRGGLPIPASGGTRLRRI